MGWVLVGKEVEDEFAIRTHQSVYLVEPNGFLIPLSTAPSDASTVLGVINLADWGVKLQAITDTLRIKPSHPKADASCDPLVEEYLLQPESEGHSECIILRDGDSFSSTRAPSPLVLSWKPPQVQVNSSVNAEDQDQDLQDLKVPSSAVRPEEETEDDEDLDNTVVPNLAPPGLRKFSRSTPRPSASRTEVVQETPTADRVNDIVEPASRHDSVDETFTPPGEPASLDTNLEDEDIKHQTDEPVDVHSTNDDKPPIQRGIRHPKVHIPKEPAKRASPAVEEEDVNTPIRSTKRRKVDINEDESITVSIRSPLHKRATKEKKRTSDDKQEEILPRSQRSSQRSTASAAVDGEYEGPTKPRVAFSNSSIQPNSSFMKFLKKAGGSNVDSVKDGCDILCIKDTTLLKTLKLLQAIALGIPIVCDKWLTDSAKAARFLPLNSYIPRAPAQEKEWNFSFSSIWHRPQDSLFEGYIICFTHALKATYKDFGEMEQVCKAVGARRVVHGKKVGGKEVHAEDTIVLGVEEGDVDVEHLLESGKTCFSKDFLTNSILRGAVDLGSEEFAIKPKLEEKGKKKRGRPKKS